MKKLIKYSPIQDERVQCEVMGCGEHVKHTVVLSIVEGDKYHFYYCDKHLKQWAQEALEICEQIQEMR